MSKYIITTDKFNQLMKDSLEKVKINEYVKLKLKPFEELDIWLKNYKNYFERHNTDIKLKLEIIPSSNMYLIRFYQKAEIYFREDVSSDILVVNYENIDENLRDYFEFEPDSESEDYCDMCSMKENEKTIPLYGKIGTYYAGDDCYIPCPGCQ